MGKFEDSLERSIKENSDVWKILAEQGNKMYKLQTAKYGSDWSDVEWEKPFDSLEKAISCMRVQETHGKYHYRVVDIETGKVMSTRTIPYEGFSVDLADENYRWLQDIASDYGISKELLFRAILHWLKVHTTPNGV